MNLENLKYPVSLKENLDFRINFHCWLAKDKEAQKDFIALCKCNPIMWYDLVAWTYNPDMPIGQMNRPFIVSVRPAQVKAINAIKSAIEIRKDVGINKGRREGASEVLMKYLAYMITFFPDVSFLVGSRSEELVDKTGDPSTLFARIDFTFSHYPMWLSKMLRMERNFKHIRNLDLNSSIDGEATNENFGAGKRVTALVLDEFGRVQPNLAQSIADTVRPISECIIVNSTHFFGASHPFNKFLQRKDLTKIDLMWWENPMESQGFYLDEESKEWPLPYRSVWFDKEVIRAASRRDVMCNIWADPCGSSDQFFDPVVNAKIRGDCKCPTYTGNLFFETNKKKICDVEFKKNDRNYNLKWFSNLVDDKKGLRPNQIHNYIIGADIGFGTGSSNSVAEIVDVNTGENIGELVCADKSPEEFADLVVALCKWVGGGTKEAYLIFENNGGQGSNFGKRVIERGLSLVYTQRTELNKSRRTLNKYGWHSGRVEKEYVLGLLQAALKESLKTTKENPFIVVINEEIVNELDGYVFYESGELDSTEVQDLSSGARKRHGDRVIGLSLCCLVLKDQPKAKMIPTGKIPFGSLAYRMRERKQNEETKKDKWSEPVKKGW